LTFADNGGTLPLFQQFDGKSELFSPISRDASSVCRSFSVGSYLDSFSFVSVSPMSLELKSGSLARNATFAILFYWALAALVLPVQVWDSQVYNLARLRIAEWGGVFQNQAWNDFRQILFPWTFDAVHLPFLWLHACYAVPSFLCFVGILTVIYRLVRPRWGSDLAWFCLLALLALPTLVYQATSTKNDLAVVFGIACWVYSIQCFRNEGGILALWFGAAGLAFAAGAKTSGLPLMAVATLWQIVQLRGRWRELRHFICAILILFSLLGSVENFVYNQQRSGHLLGDPGQIDANRNRDGVRGALANGIRYFLGNQTLGVDAANPDPPFGHFLANASETALDDLGLRDRGLRAPEYNERDRTLRFLKAGGESTSDFGLIGALALWVSLWILVSRRPSDPVWRISVLGWLSFALVAGAYAWMPWNARFLLLPMILFTTVFVLWLLDRSKPLFLRQPIFFALVAIGAIYAPLNSFNRKPTDLLSAFRNRVELAMRERPGMAEIVDDLQCRFPQVPEASKPTLLYCAGGDSWVLPVWELSGAHVIPVVHNDPQQASVSTATLADRPAYLFLLNLKSRPPSGWTLVREYAADSALYRREDS